LRIDLLRRHGKTLLLGAAVFGFAGFVAHRRGLFHRGAPRVAVTHTPPSTVLPRLEAARDAGQFAAREDTLRVGSRARSFLVVVPSTLAKGKRYPLVLSLHGDGGDGPGYRRGTPFEQASGQDAVVVYPSGRNATWDIESSEGNEDHAFLQQIVQRLAGDGLVDPARVFGSGYSSGAFVLNFMACARPGFFRAIASNAGSAPYGRSESFANGYTKCPGEKPVPVLALHGTRDFGVTLQSGRFTGEYWAYVNGCNAAQWETTDYPECKAFSECPQGLNVAYCEIEGLGHWVWAEHAFASWSFFRKQM
jgi:polyhydroxybutyrate depolymerase